MNQPSPQNPSDQLPKTVQTSPTPFNCLGGALISGGLATALYFLTASIVQTFAAKPVHSNNPIVVNITAAVRTLVVGMSALATGIFGLVAIGLVALAIQLLFQKLSQADPPSNV